MVKIEDCVSSGKRNFHRLRIWEQSISKQDLIRRILVRRGALHFIIGFRACLSLHYENIENPNSLRPYLPLFSRKKIDFHPHRRKRRKKEKKKKEGRKDREGCVRLIPGWSAVKENSNGRFYKRRGGRLKEIRRRRGRREIVGEGEKRGPRWLLRRPLAALRRHVSRDFGGPFQDGSLVVAMQDQPSVSSLLSFPPSSFLAPANFLPSLPFSVYIPPGNLPRRRIFYSVNRAAEDFHQIPVLDPLPSTLSHPSRFRCVACEFEFFLS